MHLICCAREKKPLPSILPPNLVPPSKRKPNVPNVKAGAPPAVPSVGTFASVFLCRPKYANMIYYDKL